MSTLDQEPSNIPEKKLADNDDNDCDNDNDDKTFITDVAVAIINVAH